ncbi:MAG: M56 family metallopeptidase [Bacteroidales bacterium]|nr:M56 family metallopeptidase [Bacteroidales bacterium]
MIHIKQGHSFDLIILEIITIFQWVNPFIWMYRHAIKTLHEFMADEGVLHSGVDANVYSALLFEQSTGIQISDLANNFSKSLLKRRFIMMTKKRTTKLARLKLLLVLPLALTMIMATSMSPDLIAQEKKKELPPPPPKAVKNAEKPIEAPSQLSQDEPEEVVFAVVEEMPAFPGGIEAMYTYLGHSIKYPEGAKTNKIQGTVYVTFIVRKDGSVSNVNVLRGIGHGCDDEAVRVVKEMPLWKAGKQGGKAVNVQYNLPIKFLLAPDKKEEEKK